jgi:hypothetical protein
VHRPPWAPLVAGATVLGSVVLAIDVLRRGTSTQIVTALLVLGALDLLAYVFGLRPRVIEHADGVEVVNPLREVRLRWADIEDVRARDVLVLETPAGAVRCAAVPSTGALTARTRLAGRAQVGGVDLGGADGGAGAERPLGAADVATRLVRRWEVAGGHRGGQATPRLRWHRPSVALVAVAALLTATAMGVAVLS